MNVYKYFFLILHLSRLTVFTNNASVDEADFEDREDDIMEDGGNDD